jgi:Mg2+-importing ATPase
MEAPPRWAPRGLTSEAARQRLEIEGPNVFVKARRRPVLLDVLARFGNPLVLLLVCAAAVSAFTGDARSAVIIGAMVLMSVVLDFIQERRAGKAAERLREAALVKATVSRDSADCEVPISEVVRDDVIVLAAGDLVPADARLFEARDLTVNQARLTGEPFPVVKAVAAQDATGAISAEDPGIVLMGSSVVSGGGRAIVLRTGKRTMLGEIGASLERPAPPSAFEQGTRSFGLLIIRLTLGMALFAILVNAWRGRPWLESFLFAVALAVGLTPEMLPMVVSVTLSTGAMRMSRKKVLVKRLAAIHDLGSMDVLCTDKTGTLTEARIRLERYLDAEGRDSGRVLELAHLNSHFQAGLRSPLDEAILRHEDLDVSAYSKLDEIPFDFERRCLSVLVKCGAEAPLLVVKGALEDVLRASTRLDDAGGPPLALDDDARARILARFEDLGREGFRVLGVAWAHRALDCSKLERDERIALTFAGFAVFQDPPKESARAALQSLASLGVRVKILSGDNERVTEHICSELDVSVEGILNGDELANMDDHALEARVERTTLFCRMTPVQKNRVLLALKRRKHVVGFLGDGINDAPALHAADVGVSVDGAVDVAKEAADLILLEQDLNVLKDGVLEGRRTLGNIIKYVLMGTSSNFGNMFSMAGAAVFLPYLPMKPLQILVNNFLYDLSEIAIPTDRVDDEFCERPHRWDMKFLRRFMAFIGPVSSIFDFATFYILCTVLGASEAAFQTGWFSESLATQTLVIFVIRTRMNPLQSRPSRALTTAALSVAALGLALPFVPPVATVLGFASPPRAFFFVSPAHGRALSGDGRGHKALVLCALLARMTYLRPASWTARSRLTRRELDEVTFGDDADNSLSFDDHETADLPFEHRARRDAEGRVWRGSDDVGGHRLLHRERLQSMALCVRAVAESLDQPAVEQITLTDDARESAVLVEDGQVPNPTQAHQIISRAQLVVSSQRRDVRAHEISHQHDHSPSCSR